MLRRPSNTGIVVYQGRELTGRPVPWPPIVAEETLVRGLPDPRRPRAVVCHRLQPGLQPRQRPVPVRQMRRADADRPSGQASKVRGYRCPAASHLTRAAAPLDTYSRAHRHRAAVPAGCSRAVHRHAGQGPERGLRRTSGAGRAAGAAGRHVRGRRHHRRPDPPRHQRPAGQLSQLDTRIATAPAHSPLAALAGQDNSTTGWQALDLSQRRAVLDLLMTVTMLPARNRGGTFDPDGVKIPWKR